MVVKISMIILIIIYSKIDIKYPEQALKIIKETIKNKAFENNLEAIENNYKKQPSFL